VEATTRPEALIARVMLLVKVEKKPKAELWLARLPEATEVVAL